MHDTGIVIVFFYTMSTELINLCMYSVPKLHVLNKRLKIGTIFVVVVDDGVSQTDRYGPVTCSAE